MPGGNVGFKYTAKSDSGRHVIEMLTQFANDKGWDCPVAIADHNRICRETPVLIDNQIATSLSSEGKEVDF